MNVIAKRNYKLMMLLIRLSRFAYAASTKVLLFHQFPFLNNPAYAASLRTRLLRNQYMNSKLLKGQVNFDCSLRKPNLAQFELLSMGHYRDDLCLSLTNQKSLPYTCKAEPL